ncbi:hypothetical protein HGRIS_004420 [Hohenbuehelia grisea]|uniref:Uncharacterized protein n=1 Tax=Hohenbuehelia grisea TaxID=104357 RepID=A0ABR3JC29_9AGAR
MSQNPYILRPPTWNQPSTTPQTVSHISSTASNIASSSRVSRSAKNAPGFKAPAHKHAHHLHSIPPREKSTRTLIIDHMLWVHGRTRFAQARAELGMTDRTGGPSSLHYAHRQRPENYEEDDEVGSEGEEADYLKTRAGDSTQSGHPPRDDEDERIRKQDLVLARSLRLRAEGLEKVVTSMLEQPPPVHHPINEEDLWSPPTSPKLKASRSDPHTLPNGVRLRLSLGTMINDLFARQAPPPPHRHQNHSVSLASPSVAESTSCTYTHLPPALDALATVSLPPRPSLSQSSARDYSRAASASSQPTSPAPLQFFPHTRFPTPSTRVRALYMTGADPDTANAPPALRCPRHLHTGCEICVEAKSSVKLGASGNASRHNQYASGSDSSRSQANVWKGLGGVGPGGGGITGWQDGSGIGSGLARPGVGGSALRRKLTPCTDAHGHLLSTGAGNAKLSELVPRFLRLSALVAMELGREAADDDEASVSARPNAPASSESSDRGLDHPPETSRGPEMMSPTPAPPSPTVSRSTLPPQGKVYQYALRPSREWYLLTAGLLTRAVLEGYLTAGWRGLDAVECLLKVGLGTSPIDEDPQREKAPEANSASKLFEEFDPDDLPSLMDAVKTMFPSLREGSPTPKTPAEEEFATEMIDRLRRFYDIPASTPDLSTHMEDLAWQYPAEPVERAAVRFCEAIGKWRGKPELETKRHPPLSANDIPSTPGGTTLTLDSLVHSSPLSPRTANAQASTSGGVIIERRPLSKPSIERYFLPPSGENTWNRNKRMRSPEDTRGGSAKRIHV